MDEPSSGNLRLSAEWILTTLIATYAGRVTSLRSNGPHGPPSLPRERSSTTLGPRRVRRIYGFGTVLEPRYIVGPEPLDQ